MEEVATIAIREAVVAVRTAIVAVVGGQDTMEGVLGAAQDIMAASGAALDGASGDRVGGDLQFIPTTTLLHR
jgi:hypothetical protein